MKILIIEDEMPAAKRLHRLINDLNTSIEVLAHLDSIEATVEWLNKHPKPDIAFMDIELADGQSFEIFNRVKVDFPVIFTTAYDEFALKAFEVNSIDYLLKPIEPEGLQKALNKWEFFKKGSTNPPHSALNLEALLSSLNIKPVENYKSKFLIKSGEKFFYIETEQISYFFSEDKLTWLLTREGKKYMLDTPLDHLEKQLDPVDFFRINRSIIAHYKSIGTIHTHFNGKLKIDMLPKFHEEVFVSREKASAFKEWLDS